MPLPLFIPPTLISIAASPAHAEPPRGELGCSGCAMNYGSTQSWYTSCWDAGQRGPRLEAKVNGRWKMYNRKGTPVHRYMDYINSNYAQKQLVCEGSAYQDIMKYKFTVTEEATMLNSGGYSGTVLLPMREVYVSNGKTAYRYIATDKGLG